jgi:Lrp/AsnC family leucine-responsive transcriptional regulator
MLDAIDLKIIELLQKDGRLSHAAIGKEIGLTGPSVYSRIQRLEREGIIEGYTVLLNPAKMGRGLVALVRVDMQNVSGNYTPFESFEEFTRREPEIVECYDVAGEDSYILKVRTASPEQLRDLLKRIYTHNGVNRTITSIALATIKEEISNSSAKPVDKKEKEKES